MTRVHITKRSSNAKVGKIPVTTSEQGTCPTTCAMWDSCYAKTGPQSWHWNKVSKGERGGSWDDLAKFVSQLNAGQLWRHNVSGDLPYVTAPDGQELINLALLKQLVDANKASGAKGYTYSHHKLNTHNLEALKYANKNGFTINASCESLTQADDAIRQGLPAVCVVNSNKVTPTHTPDGHKVTICPAQLHEHVQCANCSLCSHSNRSNVVAFLSHGNRSRKANEFLTD